MLMVESKKWVYGCHLCYRFKFFHNKMEKSALKNFKNIQIEQTIIDHL